TATGVAAAPPSELIEEEPHRASARASRSGASRRREASVPVTAGMPSAGRGAAGAAGAAAGCGGDIGVLDGGAERAHRPPPTRPHSTGAGVPGPGVRA